MFAYRVMITLKCIVSTSHIWIFNFTQQIPCSFRCIFELYLHLQFEFCCRFCHGESWTCCRTTSKLQNFWNGKLFICLITFDCVSLIFTRVIFLSKVNDNMRSETCTRYLNFYYDEHFRWKFLLCCQRYDLKYICYHR